ncbi:MAG: cation:proton antiporter [Mycobacteriales bacterium]
MNAYWVAAAWMGMALLASLISIRVGISVALIEIVVGAVVWATSPATPMSCSRPSFTTFLATVGSAVLTFLAGAEIDPDSLRRHWRASLGIGVVSFAVPFVGAGCSRGLATRDRTYTTLLMATGLTFGSISALYGLTNHLITQAQYSQLVTVVILSAFVPTLIAQQFFRPEVDPQVAELAGELDRGLRSRAGSVRLRAGSIGRR